ncbi:MAG: hypothetical protein ACI9BO_000102 [Zhongshania sp.]|jgi:hypothetical protein
MLNILNLATKHKELGGASLAATIVMTVTDNGAGVVSAADFLLLP